MKSYHREMPSFSPLDLHFARFIARISGDARPEVFWAVALVSRSTGDGNICLDLPAWAGGRSVKLGETSFITPAVSDWLQVLADNSAVGRPGDYRPLILDHKGRLYLYRYWDYENILVAFIRGRVQGEGGCGDCFQGDLQLLKEKLSLLFPPETAAPGPDWQKLAAATALLQKFTVISGSPGTGKTTTVTKIMALLIEMSTDKQMNIALTAPTGKAAVRLQEAVKKTRLLLPCSETVRAAIPEQASTIHRLLGSRPDSPYFRHNRENPLPADVVIVDEASMVDLPLLSKLVQALPAAAKLILLGDRDQLTSVEAGAVLGDICGASPLDVFSGAFIDQLEKMTGDNWQGSLREGGSGMQDCLAPLQHNYRFGAASGIGRVSAAVCDGDGSGAISLLKTAGFGDIVWCGSGEGGFLPFLKERVMPGLRDYLQAVASGDVQAAFAFFEGFRILCALRRGPWGIEALNKTIEGLLTVEGLIEPDRRWYPGRPIMIARNDYQQRLFNGDVGIILPDPEVGGELRAFFRESAGAVRKFLPLRLPEHETVYAMTVHKSQGSEFDRVLLILPNQDVPLLTRELVYTGLTRAKHFVEIWGAEEILRTAVGRRIARTSGLRDALWDE